MRKQARNKSEGQVRFWDLGEREEESRRNLSVLCRGHQLRPAPSGSTEGSRGERGSQHCRRPWALRPARPSANRNALPRGLPNSRPGGRPCRCYWLPGAAWLPPATVKHRGAGPLRGHRTTRGWYGSISPSQRR